MVCRRAPAAPISILGLPVYPVDLKSTLVTVSAWIEDSRLLESDTSTRPRLHQIVTLNPEIVMSAQHDCEFASILRSADLSVADGTGVVWAARRRGYKLARVTGVDLLERTAELAAEHKYQLFLLGAAPGVAAAAARALGERHPGLLPVGTFSGSPDREAQTGILAHLTQSRPDILFVAFGSPAQERWIAGLRKELGSAGVSVAVGVGGAFDTISGRIPRAPSWMRQVGLEWLYRLLRQPWRWRRMLALPRFALAVWRAL